MISFITDSEEETEGEELIAAAYCHCHWSRPTSSPAKLCSTQLSPYSNSLLSGFLAVISVNVVIAFYIYMAMKEPSCKHEPDPRFLAEAKASIRHSESTEPEDLSSTRTKQE